MAVCLPTERDGDNRKRRRGGYSLKPEKTEDCQYSEPPLLSIFSLCFLHYGRDMEAFSYAESNGEEGRRGRGGEGGDSE